MEQFNPSPVQSLILTASYLLNSDEAAECATAREADLALIETLKVRGLSRLQAAVVVAGARKAYPIANDAMRRGAMPGDAWQQAFAQI